MPKPREPIELIVAKGRKHLSKSEVAERTANEVKPNPDGIEPPDFLTAAQKKQFEKISAQLDRIGIMGETDNDALARYIVAQDQYEVITKKLRSSLNGMDSKSLQLVKLQETFLMQAQSLARDLGLTITSRCKLQVPKSGEEPKRNKFEAFSAGGGAM